MDKREFQILLKEMETTPVNKKSVWKLLKYLQIDVIYDFGNQPKDVK